MKTIDEVSKLIGEQKLQEAGAAFFALLKSNPTEIIGKFTTDVAPSGAVVPYVHVLAIDGVGYVKLRFVDTVKYLYDAKGRKLFDRSSMLSYIDILVRGVEGKAERKAYLVKQVNKTAPAGQAETHAKNIENLRGIGAGLGINLADQDSWYHTYNEGYNK